MRKKITAVVPVRKGSQRVKNKNIRPFANTTLLDIKLETLKRVDLIDTIIVSTDSPEAIQIAKKHNVKIHIREPYYASSECTNSEFFENLANSIESDYLMYTPCTAPLIKVKTYYDLINRFMNGLDIHDSISTVTLVKHHLWLDNKPLNYDPHNSPNSQDLPDIMCLTYGINIISREDMITHKNIVGNNPMFYLVDDVEGIDIDTPLDFEFAEHLYKKGVL